MSARRPILTLPRPMQRLQRGSKERGFEPAAECSRADTPPRKELVRSLRSNIAEACHRYVSASEASRREQTAAQDGRLTVKRALVHAASALTTQDASKRVLSVDMRPLVIHLLAGLEQAGIERAVVTLGHDATKVAECVTAYGFTHLQIDFVYLTLGSATGTVWRNLANSVIAARTSFAGSTEPLLIVRADNLYDSRLLRRIAEAPFDAAGRVEAFALADATPAALSWASKSKTGHHWVRVALAEQDRQRVIRLGPRLGAFDAVVAGEVYAARPKVFEHLAALFSRSLSTSLADVMSGVADRGGTWRGPHMHMHTHIHAHIYIAWLTAAVRGVAPICIYIHIYMHIYRVADRGGTWRAPLAPPLLLRSRPAPPPWSLLRPPGLLSMLGGPRARASSCHSPRRRRDWRAHMPLV